ncbi:MAG: cupredoxin domain-containing protein, partial [Nitrosotalea sp.]
VILITICVLFPHSVFSQQTAKEILQERDNAKKTGLSYNGTTLVVTQTIDKTEYKTGEKFSVTPYLQNVGNNVATIIHGEPLFTIEIIDQNNNTAFIWGDVINTIGITESLEPGMSTTGKWTSGYGGFPNISLDKAGNYTVYSMASINSEGTPAHTESIWSRPLNIVVFPENNTSQINNTMLEENTTISKQPSHAEVIISPLKQFKSGIAANNIICRSDMQLLIQNQENHPICVKLNHVSNLLHRDWSYPTNCNYVHDPFTAGVAGLVMIENNASDPSSGKSYFPQNSTVVIGWNNTVSWINQDVIAHSVTSNWNLFDSGPILP